jgi:hypothetical protein
MMLKRILFVIVTLCLLTAAGCSSGDNPSTAVTTKPAGVDVVKDIVISNQYAVKQLRINLNSRIPILLTLAPGDKVDGYFYLEKGGSVSFQISGKTLIYQSTAQTAGSANITSDRFSFTASDAQGLAYSLTFTPPVAAEKTVTPVIFVELIYTKTGEIFYPMGTE